MINVNLVVIRQQQLCDTTFLNLFIAPLKILTKELLMFFFSKNVFFSSVDFVLPHCYDSFLAFVFTPASSLFIHLKLPLCSPKNKKQELKTHQTLCLTFYWSKKFSKKELTLSQKSVVLNITFRSWFFHSKDKLTMSKKYFAI